MTLLREVAKPWTEAWRDAGVNRPAMRDWHAHADDGIAVLSTWARDLYVSLEHEAYTCHVKPGFARKLAVGQPVRLVMVELKRRGAATESRPNGGAVPGKAAALPGLFTVKSIGTELREKHFYLVEAIR